MVTVRAARVSQCLRALSFHIMKIPQPESNDPKILQIYAEGEEVEKQVIDELIEDGYDITPGTRYKKIIDVDGIDVKVTGTPDVTIHLKKNYPGEIKSMNPWKFRKVPTGTDAFLFWEDRLKEKYGSQMSIYCWLMDSKYIFWIIKEKGKKGLGETKIVKVLTDQLPDPEEMLYTRLRVALRVLDKEDIMPEKLVDCKWCNYNNTNKWWESICATTFFHKSREKISKNDRKIIRVVKDTKEDVHELMTLADIKGMRVHRFDSLLAKKYGREIK